MTDHIASNLVIEKLNAVGVLSKIIHYQIIQRIFKIFTNISNTKNASIGCIIYIFLIVCIAIYGR
jgi:hypothetical protein